jgi:hypothetical protein
MKKRLERLYQSTNVNSEATERDCVIIRYVVYVSGEVFQVVKDQSVGQKRI